MKDITSIQFLRHTGPLVVLLFIIGCAKDIDTFIPYHEFKGDIARFFEAVREDNSQTTTINIDQPIAVVTPRKTVLILQPQSLLDPQGNIVTGLVEIHILELLTKGEILLYGIPTNNRGNLLRSGGEFFITATQDGTPLALRPGSSVRVLTNVSGVPETRMELFYDVLENNDLNKYVYTWDEADGNPNTWDNVDITSWVALADSQQIVSGYGYECFSDSLNWINFGMFSNAPAQHTANVCVTLPEDFGIGNTRVFLIYNNQHSVIELPYNIQTQQFCNNYAQFVKIRVRVGEACAFVVVSEQGEGTYFYAQTASMIQENHHETIAPTHMPLDEIKAAILKF